MIFPISKDERIEWVDEESKIRFFFKPMVAELELEYLRFIEDLKKVSDLDALQNAHNISKVFDMFIAGWEHTEGKKIAPFPANGKPSDMFPLFYKMKLVEIIQNLNGLGIEEKKS